MQPPTSSPHANVGHDGPCYTRARKLMDSGAVVEAVQLLESCTTAPADSAGALWLAIGLHRQRRYGEALEVAKRACACGSTAAHYLALGAAHAQLGEPANARWAYARALELEPADLVARHLVNASGGGRFDAPQHSEVTELFDRYAPSFEEHLVAGLSYRGHEALAALLSQVRDNTALVAAAAPTLDLGCGTGLLGACLPPSGPLIGVDISSEMVARAAARGPYRVCFVADLVFAVSTWRNASLGVVAAADALGYIGPLEALFAQAARTLVEGGLLAFTVEANEALASFAMTSSRRCQYATAYLQRLAAAHAFELAAWERPALRRDGGESVDAHMVVLRRG